MRLNIKYKKPIILPNLSEIYKKYSHLTDKGTTHSYINIYKNIFSPFVNKNINLLELGVGSGGSLLLWSEYFNKSIIYGIDIKECPNIIKNHKSIIFHRINTEDKVAIDKEFFGISFDIIIDDASHKVRNQLKSFNIFSPILKTGGIYIIEDVSPENIKHFQNLYNNIKIYDLIKNKNRYDDILIAIIK
jgi:cephalosporin hydroxylase